MVAGSSWPSHRAMTVMSTPAWSRFIAAVCRRVCGVIFLACRVAQVRAAVSACLVTRCSTASRESGVPVLAGNSGLAGPALLLGDPRAEDCDGVRGERGGAIFPAFAAAVDVRPGAEADVAEW